MQLLEYKIDNDIIAFSTKRETCNGCYDGFNITNYCGDSQEHISKCREDLCNMLNINNRNLILPRQTHNDRILSIDESFLKHTVSQQDNELQGVDAVITTLPKVCIGVSTADCVPILLCDIKDKVVAAIHSGWRGTILNIIQKTVNILKDNYNTDVTNIKAVIGPSIGLEAFEVGEEVYEAFLERGFEMDKIAKRYNKWHIDLWQANKTQLIECGVPDANIFVTGICTYTNHNEYFSARRLGINSGRIFTGIMIK